MIWQQIVKTGSLPTAKGKPSVLISLPETRPDFVFTPNKLQDSPTVTSTVHSDSTAVWRFESKPGFSLELPFFKNRLFNSAPPPHYHLCKGLEKRSGSQWAAEGCDINTFASRCGLTTRTT